MTNTVVILGAPGSGKTTLMRKVIEHLGEVYTTMRTNQTVDGRRLNFAEVKAYMESKVFLFGTYDGSPYDGTDRLGRNVLPVAVALAKRIDANSLFTGWTFLLEGDRLASRGFLSEVAKMGKVHAVYLSVYAEILAKRRAQRTSEHDAEWIAQAGKLVAGKPRRPGRAEGQDPLWLKGRATKAWNLCQEYNARLVNNATEEDIERNMYIVLSLLVSDRRAVEKNRLAEEV